MLSGFKSDSFEWFRLISRTRFTCPRLANTLVLSVSITDMRFINYGPSHIPIHSYTRLLVRCLMRPAKYLIFLIPLSSVQRRAMSNFLHLPLVVLRRVWPYPLRILISTSVRGVFGKSFPHLNVHCHDGFHRSTAHARLFLLFPCFVLSAKDHYSCRTL